VNRLDVRRMLLARNWVEENFGLLKKGAVSVCVIGSDVFVSGPAKRGSDVATVVIAEVPARVIVALCESWAEGAKS
jgi:hypothetical protein